VNDRLRRVVATHDCEPRDSKCAALTIYCPQCSLRLLVTPDGAGKIEYDMVDWERLCKRNELAGPSLCQVWQAGWPRAFH
jgi:hypothetical protein